jgi:DNA-binding CsgD family transcriptional regulator
MGAQNHKLTVREIEILRLVVKELTTKQIAQQLGISPRTVDTHRKNIWNKINARSIVGLIRYAYDKKLID